MSRSYDLYHDRLVCTVLDEMRQMDKMRNYAGLGGAIEEVQIMVNRMENGLEMAKGLKNITEEYKKMRKEYQELQLKIKNLKEQVPNKDRRGKNDS